ncbi:alpha/beta hydrolase [Gordonia polyisoprenivorans]|uniref:alpha/beta hydrolase n=1 Tax=Gordonia polyisoprenivorans TaxID=84595 RepID=UPI00036BE632|nr:alpha/beta fold hydrolase [Gordonia polyisoprenivorans]
MTTADTDRRTVHFESVRFESGGTNCDAWFFAPTGTAFATDAGVPVVVMAHGFCGTKDSGLEPFARRLADAGLAVFAFDYRNFGLSDGEPRQRVSMSGQAADYHAAIDAAGRQPGVDASRIVLWGLSQSGGHVLIVAAERARTGRDDVAAVISAVPMVSGLAAGVHHYPQVGAVSMLRSTAVGIGSALGARLGRDPVMMPVVGKPGDKAALTSDGYLESYLAIAGPSWRNEVDASIGLELGSFRADKAAPDVAAPVLMQIADLDRGAPPHAAAKAGFAARAEVRHYPCDHFGIFAEVQDSWFEPVVSHQIFFLTRHLATSAVTG